MDIVVEGGSTVSNTPLLTEDNDHHDHDHDLDVEEQVGRRNSTAEVRLQSDGDDNRNINDEEEQQVYVIATNGDNSITTTSPIIVAHQTIINNNEEQNDNSNEEIELSLLLRASFVSFWNNYVKYYGYFSRWLFFVIISNITAFVYVGSVEPICLYDDESYSWQYQLAYSFLQFVLLATSMWFFIVAKLIDQQVINLDRIVQYEQAATTADDEEIVIDTEQQQQQQVNNNYDIDLAVEVGGATANLPRLLPNYDNIYGRVSRKIDRFLQEQLPSDADVLLSTTTSCLINFSYVLWSFFLAATFHGITDLVVVNYFASGSTPYDNEYSRKCIGHYTKVPSTMLVVLILIGTGCWLLIREGLPSGIISVVVAIVTLFHLLLFKVLDDPDLYSDHMKFTIIVLVSGTILFHIMLCCYSSSENHNNNNNSTKNMLIWAVYGWIGAFWALNTFSNMNAYHYNDPTDEIGITSLVLLAFTGIVLQHPIIQLMGVVTVLVSIIILPFIDFYFDILDFLPFFLMGFGLIWVGNWISKNINTNTIITGCGYVFKLCRCMIMCRCFSH